MGCHVHVCYKGNRVVVDCVKHRLRVSMIGRMVIVGFALGCDTVF